MSWFSDLFIFKRMVHLQQLKGMHERYVKGVGPFFRRRYIKGASFLSKMAYKRVGGWTSVKASV